MKYITYFLKQMILPIIYLLFMMVISIGITSIDQNLLWLKYLLFSLSLTLYGTVIFIVSFKEGQDAVKIRHMNDLERINIIKTGEDRPLNLVKEYKLWKGFSLGAFICSPLIILLIIHTICILINPSIQWAGGIGTLLYSVFFVFFRPALSTPVTPAYYYFSLIALPVMVLITGAGYMLGGRKQQLQYALVEDKHREIYGEDD